MVGEAKTLDEELTRTLGDRFNYTEPAMTGTAVRVYGKTATIRVREGDDTFYLYNVQYMKPIYGAVGDLNLAPGDTVVVIFEGGSIESPLIIGKL